MFILGLVIGIVATAITMYFIMAWFVEKAYWMGYDDAKAGREDRRKNW